MGLPVVVRATFMLSGMLGLKLEGLVDGNGKPMNLTTVNIPFTITTGNQTKTEEIESHKNITEPPRIFHNKTWNVSKYSSNWTTCGPGVCTDEEVCVTWVKDHPRSPRKSRESPFMIHECLPNDGNHYTKMDPTSGMLCKNDEMHSIIWRPQPCLSRSPSCDLVWKFRCLPKSDEKDVKTHSCRFKRCPSHTLCLEVIECGIDPPCITKAVCTRGSEIVS